MGLFDRLVNIIGFRRKEVNILVVGLNNSGKSTVINHFKGEDNRCSDVVPTVGFNVEKFSYKNIDFTAFDMSGHDRYRSLWEHYYRDCQGIIFIVDSNDALRLIVAKEELDLLLQHPDIAGPNETNPSKGFHFYVKESRLPSLIKIHLPEGRAYPCRRLPILFLANKMDLPDSLTTVKLVAGLGLDRIKNKPWHIRSTNAVTGEGLQSSIEWLTDQIKDIHIHKNNH